MIAYDEPTERVAEISDGSVTVFREVITRCRDCRYARSVSIKGARGRTYLICHFRPSIQHTVRDNGFCNNGRPRQ